MGKLDAGGANVLDSTVLPPQKPDNSATLQQAKQLSLESKERMLKLNATSGKFVVSLNSAKHSQSRMLTPTEIEELRKKNAWCLSGWPSYSSMPDGVVA